MSRKRIKVNRPISSILTLKFVAIATSLKRSGKRGRPNSSLRSLIYDQIPTTDENLVKIGPIDPGIICLKGFVFKMRVHADNPLKLRAGLLDRIASIFYTI